MRIHKRIRAILVDMSFVVIVVLVSFIDVVGHLELMGWNGKVSETVDRYELWIGR